MIRSTFISLWTISLLAIATELSAQQPPYDVFPPADAPYYRVRYEASTQKHELVYPVNYTIWIPKGVQSLRGVIVHQHGCGEGSCKSGLTGAYDLHWQALAKKHDCALLAPSYEQPDKADCQMWCDPRNGSSAAFQKCLVDLGAKSGHPELPKIPWALWGHSGGGHWAGGMVLLHPQRVAAAWLRSGVPLLKADPERATIKAHTLPDAALKVPVMCNLGTKEGVTVKDDRFAGVWPANEAFFNEVRGKGGLISMAVDPLSSHECGNQRYLAIPWLDACLSARLPKVSRDSLKTMPTHNVWLAPINGAEAVPAAKFAGDPLKAAWLPNEAIAKAWMQYVKDTGVTDITLPPAPTNLRQKGNELSWEAEADVESGLASFIIERDGKFLARVPEQGKNPFGRPVFQNLQYSDTPTQPLMQMRYTDITAEPDRKHTYRVTAVNTVGLTSRSSLAGDDVAVTASRRLHPMLIRNEAGPVLQIVVDVQRGKDIRLQAMHFKLEGTDDVGDIESLGLFATGDKQEFATTIPFGMSSQAQRTVAFQDDVVLRAGKNVFWLSCRLKPTADLTHTVKAVCTSVETTAGQLSAKDLSPGVRHRIGVALRKHKDDGVHTYRIPALTTTPKGTLLCVYDMRRRMGRDLQEDIDIGLSRSTDGGQTWEPVRVIMDMGKYGGLPEEQNGCSDPGIIVDHMTGEIFCFAVWMNGNPGKHQWTGDGSAPGYEIGKAAQILMVSSKDDGRTWAKPVNLTHKLKRAEWWLFAPSPQQGINLGDGTLVMPVQGRDAKGVEFSTIMTSSDHGETWIVGTPAYSGGSECQAVQLGDGSIMLNMRNEHERFRAVFVTKDLGKTWRPHETNRKTLIEPNCNGSLLRIDYTEAGANKHALLFSNPHTQKGRTHQTIQVSFDDGRTWPASHHLLLDEGRGAGYPSLTRVDDRHVGIVYEGSQAHLVFEKIPLAELLKVAAR